MRAKGFAGHIVRTKQTAASAPWKTGSVLVLLQGKPWKTGSVLVLLEKNHFIDES